MHTTFALLTLAASIGPVLAQGIAAGTLSPSSPAPAGCSETYDGSFEITVVLPNAKRDLEKRASCTSSGVLVATLSNGVLTDEKGRIGGIVANRQFQFDGPPSQTGTIYNGGFSICTNGSLALGGSAIFYQCLSGSFYNLYDEAAGASCESVLIDIIPCTITAAGAAVTQIADGQPQGISATPVSQYTDGQIQVTALPGSLPPVSQISDGQIQATTAVPAPVSQIPDGQIQATTAVPAAPVSQIPDGQIQATKAAAPVSQIPDGQIQAATAAPPVPVSQISDGQVQAPTAVPVAQISDGQIQATSAVVASHTSALPAQFTGAANSIMYGAEFVGAAIAAVAFAVL